MVSHPILPPKQDFGGTRFVEKRSLEKLTPKRPNIIELRKKTFSLKTGMFFDQTPNRVQFQKTIPF